MFHDSLTSTTHWISISAFATKTLPWPAVNVGFWTLFQDAQRNFKWSGCRMKFFCKSKILSGRERGHVTKPRRSGRSHRLQLWHRCWITIIVCGITMLLTKYTVAVHCKEVWKSESTPVDSLRCSCEKCPPSVERGRPFNYSRRITVATCRVACPLPHGSALLHVLQ